MKATVVGRSTVYDIAVLRIDATDLPVVYAIGRKAVGYYKFRRRAIAGEWTGFSQLPHYVNAVARRHQEVSQDMFPAYRERIQGVTNGVHAVTWTSEPFRELFDRHIPRWRYNNLYLRYAVKIPLDEIRDAHAAAKG